MNNKRFGCLSVGLLVLLLLSVLANVLFISTRAQVGRGMLAAETPKFDENVVLGGSAGVTDKIAVISLRGIITNMEPGMLGETAVDDLKLQLRQATEDARVKAIVLSIDSPGGEVTASDTIYNAVRETREKKPVVIQMGSLSASGGYYVACGGTWLIANDTTLTGSIGVIMQAISYQALFSKVGLEMRTFKSGQFKDMMSGSREMTKEEAEYVQSLVMQSYGKFVGIVAKERNLTEEQLVGGLADGRILTGKDALEGRLIDQIGDTEDAYAKAMELGRTSGATIVRYDTGFRLSRLFRLLGESRSNRVEVDVAGALAPRLEAGRLYYLPSLFAL